MHHLKCIVIDDDLLIQGMLMNYINKVDDIDLISVFNNPKDLIESGLIEQADVLFLDIRTPIMTGIEFLESTKINAQLVLMTSNKEYAFDGFENGATDFLLKPISFQRFQTAINKVKANVHDSAIKKDYIFIKSNKEFVKLRLEDIIYITAASEYLNIYTTNGRHMIYSNMRDFLNRLDDNFIQIHRSHIISLNKIEKVSKHHVELNGVKLSVSKSHAQELFDALGLE